MTLLSSFFSLIESEICKQASRQVATEQPKVYEHAKRRNWRYYNVSRDENPQRENEMDSPSFESFHAQLNCKLTNGNKNQTQLHSYSI